MEVKCIKCRYKFDVIPDEERQEMTIVCPRCGEAQTITLPPSVSSVEEVTPTAPVTPAEPSVVVVPPVVNSDDIPEEHMKYIPHAQDNTMSDVEQQETVQPAAMPDEKPIETTKEKVNPQNDQTSKRPADRPTPIPPKKNNSCGKMFAMGCLIVAALAIITIAILSLAGKSFFNSISSTEEDEQEQVDGTDRNITIQPDVQQPASDQQQTPDVQQPTTNTQPEPVTDTGGEGNDNTSVQEPTKPTEEEKQKTEKDVATAGGSFNCRGTMDGNNIDLKLNITSGGFVTGKLTDNSNGTSLDITGDRYGDDYYLTASNNTDLIKITLKKQGRTLKGTAKKELHNMPISVSY